MREILFRGKRTDNGEWIEGAYSPFNLNFFGEREEKPHIIIISDDKNIDGLWCEVIPETVGQYTGLTDNYNERIFEGDIVETYDGIYAIIWDNRKAVFYLRNPIAKISTGFYQYFSTDLEVIGNIHDNPELLQKI